ncbi:putative transporter [Campylobacter sp. RM16187]|uniref:putative transporter n=1 Tax=Campylobacter sp. RM16187 TaxID=1660063 RepID=UPI0021B5D21B|nr:putative transporter [Campylobacter sp. RM16187]QKG30189.1 long-chain fatty acid ABC transporter, fused permease and ATPase components, SbmA family [Campylobacter sp. RM16187]
MFLSFFKSKKWAKWAYGGIILISLSLILQTYINIQFNNWYKNFYDILQNVKEHDIQDFWAGIRLFLYLAMPYIMLRVFISFFSSHWIFRWREAMTFSYLSYWRKVEKDIEGSSQRMQEDTYRFAKIMEDLGVDILDSIMTLIAFIPILWGLSAKVNLPYIKDIPGSLVWIALIISVGGLIISWFVGIKLPGLEYNNQKVEAAFRKELVLAEDNKISYAHPATIVELFTGLKFNYSRLFLHYGYFNMWLYSYHQISIIIPYLIMGGGLFTGLITLGVLVQVKNAFAQVRSSFGVFISNWKTITELRSIHKRLKEFEHNIGYKKMDWE